MNKELPVCPVETTLMLIGDRWKVLILRDLLEGTKRFGDVYKRQKQHFGGDVYIGAARIREKRQEKGKGHHQKHGYSVENPDAFIPVQAMGEHAAQPVAFNGR